MTPANISSDSVAKGPPRWQTAIDGLHDLLCLMIAALPSLPLGSAKMVSMARSIRGVTRAIIAAEVARYQYQLTRAMLSDPAWRMRVYFDLGGAHAMAEWQRRFLAGPTNAPQNPPLQATPPMPRKPRHHKAIKTDRNGHFTPRAPAPWFSGACKERAKTYYDGDERPDIPFHAYPATSQTHSPAPQSA